MSSPHEVTSSPSTYSGSSSSSSKRLSDYEPLAKICASFVLELFAPESFSDTRKPFETLPYFIARAFSQSQLPEANALAALTLLQRLKSHSPTRSLSSAAKGREAERLFLSSYIAATKVLSDDRYRLQFWVVVGQNKFSTDELAQMEKEFFEGLEWDVRIDDATLAIYQLLVERRKQVDETKNKPRSSSMESHSSAGSLDSADSSSTGSSLSSTMPSTPADPALSDPVIAAGLLRMKESEENMASLDQRIEELQKKFDSLAASAPCRSQAHSPKPHRHGLREKLRHVFH
ncbi:hypothetical protein NP233_g10072 [Leucocoprinus birnbaumii]|uniref:Cyclin N-terminal domain-containing protein n=1 Tax=Leucocoprinus birnbaumii TaxID=56174 RepID=A0AAD5VMN8_9AGAR|nr:hypothetical protein NP233_g10072 [Leucocoprinus birnbaumii]